jgi:pimeloyl-ACP methyl ester carboxylesterase
VPTVEGAFADLPGRGLRLYYRDWGGDGPSLVLLHGLSSNSRIWDWTAPLLAEHFRVFALDQRGHGLSDKPESYTFEETSGDLAAFFAVHGIEKPVLVGHSWGGSVVLHFAATNPGASSALVMVDGGFIELSGRLPWEEAERVMRPPQIDGTPVDTFIGFMKRWPQTQEHWSDELGEMILSNFEVREGKIYRRLTIPHHMKIAKELYDLNARSLLAALSEPALAISCHRAPNNEQEKQWQEHRSEGLERLKTEAPLVQVHVMEDTIHDVPIQRPQELVRVITSFLAGLG